MSGVLGSGRRAQPSGGLRRNDPGRATSTESGAHSRPTPIDVPSFEPGQIVIVEWRDALPKEANRRRPAVVIEDAELFDPAYPNVILVPLTEDATLVIADLSVRIDPTCRRTAARKPASQCRRW